LASTPTRRASIDNPAFEGSPELTVDRTSVADGVVVATGTGTGAGRHRQAGRFRFAFHDVFTFRDGLIAEIDSYVVLSHEVARSGLAAMVDRRNASNPGRKALSSSGRETG
jgi:ketosteroid isomerase-like protein